MTAVVHSTVRWRGMIALVAVLLLAAGIGQTSLGHAILGRAGLFQPPGVTPHWPSRTRSLFLGHSRLHRRSRFRS